MVVTTKSALVLRDLDLLGAMAADRCAAMQLSIATLDSGLAWRLGPRAASPQRRLDVIHELTQAGIPTGVLVSPLPEPVPERELPHGYRMICLQIISTPNRLAGRCYARCRAEDLYPQSPRIAAMP